MDDSYLVYISWDIRALVQEFGKPKWSGSCALREFKPLFPSTALERNERTLPTFCRLYHGLTENVRFMGPYWENQQEKAWLHSWAMMGICLLLTCASVFSLFLVLSYVLTLCHPLLFWIFSPAGSMGQKTLTEANIFAPKLSGLQLPASRRIVCFPYQLPQGQQGESSWRYVPMSSTEP